MNDNFFLKYENDELYKFIKKTIHDFFNKNNFENLIFLEYYIDIKNNLHLIVKYVNFINDEQNNVDCVFNENFYNLNNTDFYLDEQNIKILNSFLHKEYRTLKINTIIQNEIN